MIYEKLKRQIPLRPSSGKQTRGLLLPRVKGLKNFTETQTCLGTCTTCLAGTVVLPMSRTGSVSPMILWSYPTPVNVTRTVSPPTIRTGISTWKETNKSQLKATTWSHRQAPGKRYKCFSLLTNQSKGTQSIEPIRIGDEYQAHEKHLCAQCSWAACADTFDWWKKVARKCFANHIKWWCKPLWTLN